MNRAFVSENDGWRRCRKFMEDCMMADEHGNCILEHCRIYPDREAAAKRAGRAEKVERPRPCHAKPRTAGALPCAAAAAVGRPGLEIMQNNRLEAGRRQR